MDPPSSYMEVNPENPMYHCDLYDAEIVHKIAQAFLPGLASACVDNTTGGIFKSPGSVAVEIRKEMVGYLTQRSETFVAETVNIEGAPEMVVLTHPYDIISYYIDDFASSKRNFFSKVSTWLLSDRREDRIDDFVQEMEMKGFWLIGRRETVAKTLVRNVDFKNEYHCNMKFNLAQDLSNHIPSCRFRTVICSSEGCNARFCAAHLEDHESVCPFKIIPCEQKCPDEIMRRDMDRHCITVCPMKLVNCTFHPVGCQGTIPRCNVEEHNLESLQSHLIFILQTIHKDVSKDDLKKRAEQVEKESSPEKLVGARDVRSLTYMVKNIESKLGPIEITPSPKAEEKLEVEKNESKDSPEVNKESTDSPKDETAKTKDHSESSSDGEEEKKEEPVESMEEVTELLTNGNSITQPSSGKDESLESPKVDTDSPIKSKKSNDSLPGLETPEESKESSPPTPKAHQNPEESRPSSPESPKISKNSRPQSPESPRKSKDSRPSSPESPKESKKSCPSSPESPAKMEEFEEALTNEEVSKESPSSSDNE